MGNEIHKRPGVAAAAGVTRKPAGDLSGFGSARRDFLRRVSRLGAAVTVFGLGTEATLNALFTRSALPTAAAAGTVLSSLATSGNLPTIPVDQNPPPPPVPTGTIRWVATNGSDSNRGTETSPFATVQKALNECSAGDGIYVKAGTYVSNSLYWKSGVVMRGAPGTTREQVIISHSTGGWSGIIMLEANNPTPIENVQFYGMTIQGGPVITGTDSRSAREANWGAETIYVRGHIRNLKFTNCVIRHALNRGVFITLPSGWNDNYYPDNIEVSHCRIYKTGTGTAGAGLQLARRAGYGHFHHNEIHSDVDGIVTEGNYAGSLFEFNHIGPGVAGDGIKGSEDAIDIKTAWRQNPLLSEGQRTIVRNNILHGQVMQTGVTVQFGTERVDIHGNRIYNNRTGIWMRGDDGSHRQSAPISDIRIWDNEIFDNWGGGIEMVQNGPDDVLIDNNRIYDNGTQNDGPQRAGIRIVGRDITIRNNVISNSSQVLTGKPQFWFENNLAVSQTLSDRNMFFLPDTSFNVARVGSGSAMKLTAWRSFSGQDENSTEALARYEPASPPAPPRSLNVAGVEGIDEAGGVELAGLGRVGRIA